MTRTVPGALRDLSGSFHLQEMTWRAAKPSGENTRAKFNTRRPKRFFYSVVHWTVRSFWPKLAVDKAKIKKKPVRPIENNYQEELSSSSIRFSQSHGSSSVQLGIRQLAKAEKQHPQLAKEKQNRTSENTRTVSLMYQLRWIKYILNWRIQFI